MKTSNRRITLGICAMDKKAKSKPMQEILSRLSEQTFDILIFGNNCILSEPVENWPIVEYLISFYSTGFPLHKAIAYWELRKPFLINDLKMQYNLQDRRTVYRMLQSHHIAVPNHVFVERDLPGEVNVIEEYDEYIVINGFQLNKPLVEKPVDADDHNVYIYYPMSAGGGSKRLFRKVGDRSSEFYPKVNEIRREGSYIYEEFINTQGIDVKVYTVGPSYGHAQARKSPVVDGRVMRDENGKEMHLPVMLTQQEKEFSMKITRAFKQTVCGFDILRSLNSSLNHSLHHSSCSSDSLSCLLRGPPCRVPGKSFVCDVNGWSFVKSSKKYYDDCARVLNELMVTASRTTTHLHHSPSLLSQLPRRRLSPGDRSTSAPLLESPSSLSSGSNSRFRLDRHSFEPDSPELDYSCEGIEDGLNRDEDEEELLCVISVIRHGDRTPKQKIKMKLCQESFLDFYQRNTPSPTTSIKLKSKATLLEFLELVKLEISEMEKRKESGGGGGDEGEDHDQEAYVKLCCIRDVLEDREIHGLTRKIQLKPEKWVVPESLPLLLSQDEDDLFFPSSPTAATSTGSQKSIGKSNHSLSSMGTGMTSSVNRNRSGSYGSSGGSSGVGRCPSNLMIVTEVLCIVKWGGDLTPLGEKQAELVGENFRRTMYPDPSGDGILRLHSTFRHDLKIKASDEGRVMKTAAAFTKGLLELEGDLTPVMVSLVTVQEKNTQMLDHHDNSEVKRDLDYCKGYLTQILQLERVMTSETIRELLPDCDEVLRENLLRLENPRERLRKMHLLIKEVIEEIRRLSHLSDLQRDQRQGQGEGEGQEPGKGPGEESGKGQEEGSPVGPVGVPYLNETFIMMLDRWMKLDSGFFRSKDDLYDLSKVPELHDMTRYDVLHNSHLLSSSLSCPSSSSSSSSSSRNCHPLNELYQVSKLFADCVVPQEYGISNSDKRSIGRKMCHALLHKIQYDLMVAQSGSNVDMQCQLDESHASDEMNLQSNSTNRSLRTRLYFTSESHLYTLFHVLGYPAAASASSSSAHSCASPSGSVSNSSSAFASPLSPAYDPTASAREAEASAFSRGRLHGPATAGSTWTRAGGTGAWPGMGGGPFFDPDHERSHHNARELAYLSHLTIRLFENKLTDSKPQYRCELLLSPGAASDPCLDKSAQVAPAIVLNRSIDCQELIGYLQEAISGYETSLLPRARSDGDSEMMLG